MASVAEPAQSREGCLGAVGQAEGPAMTSPDALTDLLDTYLDVLGLASIIVVVVWLVWEAFRYLFGGSQRRQKTGAARGERGPVKDDERQ
jgi:membrane protein implicated in regulation of membrane protease activity